MGEACCLLGDNSLCKEEEEGSLDLNEEDEEDEKNEDEEEEEEEEDDKDNKDDEDLIDPSALVRLAHPGIPKTVTQIFPSLVRYRPHRDILIDGSLYSRRGRRCDL